MDGKHTDVIAHTTSGSITIRNVPGTLDLKTTCDRIDVDAPCKRLTAENSIAAETARIDVSNSNGSIAFTGSLTKGDHSFKTTAGGVTITLPASFAFAIDAQTTYAKIRNDFKLTQTKTAKETQLVGTVGDKPTATLKISASSGDIILSPRK